MTFSTNIVRNFLFPFILLLFTCGIIFYYFNEIPQNLSKDEVEFAQLALSLRNSDYTPYSPLATGHTTLYFYIIEQFFDWFGINSFALRLPSAIFGVLNVIVLYFIMLKVFSEEKIKESLPFLKNIDYFFPFLLVFIFLSLRWYFSFARFSFEATFLLFLELISIYALFVYKEKKRALFLVICGVFAGLAYNSYTPGRIFFLLPLLFVLYENRNVIKARSQVAKPFFAFLVPFILVILPLTLYLMVTPDSRVSELTYINNTDLSLAEKTSFLTENINKTVKMFTLEGDLNGRHNYPGKPNLNLFISILFILGFFLSLKNLRNNYNHVFFLMFFIISIIPSLLTYSSENPNMLRTFTAIPSIIYFIGVALLQIFSIKKLQQKTLFYALILCIGLSALYEVRTYFKYQVIVFEEAFDANGKLEQLIDVPQK